MALTPLANLPPYTHYLLSKAGSQKNPITRIVQEAINNNTAFQNPAIIQRLSNAVNKLHYHAYVLF